MAIYSCNISNVSRARGSSSCATLSYITAEKVREERTNSLFQYGRDERVLAVGTVLPSQAPLEYQNPETLFNAIENFERAENARTAKKIMVALPLEFDLARQIRVVEQYIRNNITAENYCCTYAIHLDREGQNPHAHILIANRQINEKGEWGGKRKMEYALDEKGERIPIIDKKTGEQKTDKRGRKQWKRINVEVNPLDRKAMLERLRKQWAVECNKLLPPARAIDHRSNADRGIEREPTVHEGYSARKIEQQGGISERCELNRQIKRRNSLLIQIQNELRSVRGQIAKYTRELEEKIRERLDRTIRRAADYANSLKQTVRRAVDYADSLKQTVRGAVNYADSLEQAISGTESAITHSPLTPEPRKIIKVIPSQQESLVELIEQQRQQAPPLTEEERWNIAYSLTDKARQYGFYNPSLSERYLDENHYETLGSLSKLDHLISYYQQNFLGKFPDDTSDHFAVMDVLDVLYDAKERLPQSPDLPSITETPVKRPPEPRGIQDMLDSIKRGERQLPHVPRPKVKAFDLER